MPHTIRLALVLHNHQPIGNFDGVMEQAYQDSYRPSSEPLINIRFALKAAVLEGLIPEFVADGIIKEIKALYFPFRSYRLVVQRFPKLKSFIEKNGPNQKRDDAKLLLQTIARAGRDRL